MVSNMLRGIIPSDTSMVIVVAGHSMIRGPALSVLKHLCWIRYSLGLIIQLIHNDASNPHTPSPPYEYLGTGLHAKLRADIASAHHIAEDRIAIRHIAMFASLESLFEKKATEQGVMTSDWPETDAWKLEFPQLERSAFLSNFRVTRNAFAHMYATPKASDAVHGNLFSPPMKGRYAALMMDVARAINLFEVALRTQKVWGTVS
jgi:hypothetical protein